MKWLINFLLRPKWVVFTTHDDPSESPELGLRIWGVIFALYKAEVYSPSQLATVRPPEKREFGESLHPISWWWEKWENKIGAE